MGNHTGNGMANLLWRSASSPGAVSLFASQTNSNHLRHGSPNYHAIFKGLPTFGLEKASSSRRIIPSLWCSTGRSRPHRGRLSGGRGRDRDRAFRLERRIERVKILRIKPEAASVGCTSE
jgi:hypothetical protein